jgi:hypothetical protein
MSAPEHPPLTERLRGETGMTLVEVLVAAIVLILGSLATMAMVDAAHRTTYRAAQSQVIANRLQLEMEAVKRLEYSKVALTATPSPSGNASSPNNRVTSYGGYSTFALNRNGTNEATLVVNGTDGTSGGLIAPGPASFASGDVNGYIYRYVTWIDDPSCPENLCPGSKDLKRITIAIWANTTASGGQRVYQQIQSDVVDGQIQQEDDQVAPAPAAAEAVKYFLSDTTCDQSSRAAASTHDSHNTLGACSAGMQTGSTEGAPDRLFLTATPSTGYPGTHDLSSDIVTQQPSEQGLQMQTQTKGCEYAPSRSTAQVQVHRWLTGPVATGGNFVLDGAGELALFTKTINGAVMPGKICVWLFTRERTNTGGEADNLITNSSTGLDHFEYSATSWSASNWAQYKVPLTFEEAQIKPGDRLGVAIAIDGPGTGGDALQFNYNTAGYDSILYVYTTTKSRAPG